MGVKQVATTNGFRLGLDWSNPPENIDVQALTQAQQCEFDRTDNALRTVPGIRVLYDFGLPIETLYHDVYRNKWYFSSGRNLYETDFSGNTLLGTLNGTERPRYHAFGGDILIASGDKLQAISGAGKLSTIESPACDIVSSHSGRVLIASTNSHRLNWSAVGDYNAWNHNSNDADRKSVV